MGHGARLTVWLAPCISSADKIRIGSRKNERRNLAVLCQAAFDYTEAVI